MMYRRIVGEGEATTCMRSMQMLWEVWGHAPPQEIFEKWMLQD